MRPTSFVFVSADAANQFRQEWWAIDRRFPALSEAPEDMLLAEHWTNMAALRDAARIELREAMREAAKLEPGPYPIAV